MATHGWQSDLSLAQALAADHANFNYYQLIRLLRYQARQNNCDPDQVIRFSGDIGAAFPAQEISAVNTRTPNTRAANTHNNIYGGGDVTELKTPNYSIASVMGPLAEPYVEWMRDRVRDGDLAMAHFIDLFNNRFHVLRYEAKANRFPGLHIGRPENSTQGSFIEALIGLAENYAFQRIDQNKTLQKRKLLAIAGLLINHRRSAPVLERIFCTLLNVRVRITQLIGAWHTKQKSDLTLLGRQNLHLGSQTFLGSKVWDQQARICLYIGPLPYAAYWDLLPGNKSYRDLACVLRYITNRIADCEVVLELDRETLPTQRNSLSTQKDTLPTQNADNAEEYRGLRLQAHSSRLRLGQTAWLRENVKGSAPRIARFVIPAFAPESIAETAA